MACWVGNYMFQASWRKIDALCPNFPKFLISSSHQCCSWMCRWVCCIPASLLQFSEHCQLFLRTSPIPLMSPDSDLGRSHHCCGGLPAAPADWGEGISLHAESLCGIQLPCICWLYPKQMDEAQDEGCNRGAMVPSQRLKERDAASWGKGRGKTESLVCLIFSEDWVLQKAEFHIAILNQTYLFR